MRGGCDAGIRCCSSSGRMAASATALLVALINLLASNGVLAQQVGNLTCEKGGAMMGIVEQGRGGA